MRIVKFYPNILVKDTRNEQIMSAKIRKGYFNNESENLYALWVTDKSKPLSAMYDDLDKLEVSQQYELLTPFKVVTGKNTDNEKVSYFTNIEDAELMAKDFNTVVVSWKSEVE